MRYNKMVMSAIVLTLLNTGCVKPTEEINSGKPPANSNVYNEQPSSVVYDDTAQQPIIYADPTTETSDTIYSSGGDSTIVTPTATDSYQPTTPITPRATDHYQPTAGGGGYSSTSSAGGAYGAYDDPYSSGGDGYTGGYSPIDDPYSSGTPSSTYSTNIPYGSTPSTPSYESSSGTHKGIQLQVAALKDYYAAEEFRRGLSLDPKYSSYVKRGAINRVIITGISTRAEAKALAARQFPGAFIVGGYETGSSSYSSSPTHREIPSSYTHSIGDTNSGIGVQVGAFSSKSRARAVAQEKAGGEYTAIVKTVKVRGKTIYKAILLGFASRADAKRAIMSGRFGDAFVVTGIHP